MTHKRVKRSRLAITLGDPDGIGPEIVDAALRDPRVKACNLEVTLCGQDEPTVMKSNMQRGPSVLSGQLSYHAVMQAVALVKSGLVDGIVTAPISKEAWHMAGHVEHPGHTELLAQAFESPDSGMLFVGPKLRVILATIHVGLREVPKLLTVSRVLATIELGFRACVELGIERPRIAVAGINPHAGEGGLFGPEDADAIVPAIARCAQAGMDVGGPFPGDTIFARAASGEFDLVVAMYHDQGLIPVKLVDGKRSVNVTVGLRWQGKGVVRTSPAHGTAYDIAGKGQADATSMIEAICLAHELVQRAE
jgi:4-hydroxythreonine-4-phosphate dehydrogenase